MNRYADEIAAAARIHGGIDPPLVEAIIGQESDGETDAFNPEPKYRYFWNVRTGAPFRAVSDVEVAAKFPPKDFPTLAGDPDQEWWSQQASWGLMQLMGAVAREHGFRGKYLTRLCSDPALNIDLGCQHLAGHLAWASRLYVGLEAGRVAAVTRSALAAYNGGRGGNAPTGPIRNREYADEVLSRYRKIRGS